MLSRRLQREGHTTATAVDGNQALEMIREQAFDLVLLDIMMPEMNGYQVLEHMKGDEELRHIPVIMISAVDEIESVVKCVEMGAEDYLPKPFNPVLLRARVNASLEKKRLRDKEQLYAKSLERDLEIGREIQLGFFPESLPQPKGWEIASYFKAARQVAGDFYDAFPLASGQRVGFVIADVCDKGVGAALFMALFRTLIRAIADQEQAIGYYPGEEAESVQGAGVGSLQNAITLTNNYIARTHDRSNMFATVFFGMLNPATGELAYINGGHEAPLIIRSERKLTPLAPSGPAVGLFPDMVFEVKYANLDQGDMLVAFTDGVTEARDAEGVLYTEERLVARLKSPQTSATGLLDHIAQDVQAHMAGTDPSDDITMIAIRRG